LLRRENPRIGVHDANLKMMYAIPERTGVAYINFFGFFCGNLSVTLSRRHTYYAGV
jgi:hypothetical protein